MRYDLLSFTKYFARLTRTKLKTTLSFLLFGERGNFSANFLSTGPVEPLRPTICRKWRPTSCSVARWSYEKRTTTKFAYRLQD